MNLINFLLMLFLITIADVKANAQTCISLFEEQKIISKLSYDQQDTLMSLAQHQVDVTNNHLMPQMQKIQILQQIESEISNFMRDMEFNTYETKLFLAEYRALVFKAKESLNSNIDLQIGEVENKQNAIKEAQSKREKIKLIKKKYWELEHSKYPDQHPDFKTMTAPLDYVLLSISKVDKLTKEHIDDFKLILEFGGNPLSIKFERQAFFEAIIKDHHKLIELMLEHDINLNTLVAKGHQLEGQTALMIASALGNTNTVRLLLEKGANPNALNPNARSALYFASSAGHIEIVKLLIGHKADINSFVIQPPLGRSTALHVAIEGGHLDLVKLFVQLGADTKAKNVWSQTPLQLAEFVQKNDIVQFLKAHAKSAPLSEKIKDKLIDIKNYFKGIRQWY